MKAKTEQITAHVQQWKKDIVDAVSKEVGQYKTVAVINLENLPSHQNQQIRAKIRDKAKIIVTRKNLIELAIEKCGKSELTQLVEYLRGMPALILTNDSAFDLFRILKENMTSASAKAGQISPKDIWVRAGPTSFAPGPVIGELGAASIIAGIDGGKVVIKKDCLVVKEGDSVPAEAASILSRLNIKPMRVGINLVAAIENGQIFERKVLDVNVEEYVNNLRTAILNAKKLAIGANILTPETIIIKLQEAQINAKKLAIGAEILCDETREYLMKKAETQAAALKEHIPGAPVAEPKEEKKKEPVKEEQEAKEDNKSESTASEKEASDDIKNGGK